MWHTTLQLQPSAIREIVSLSAKKRAAGETVFDLGIGEIDIPTPEILQEETKKIISQKPINYTTTTGIPSLKKEWTTFLNKKHHSQFGLENICVTPGGVFALYTIIATFIKKGDEILLIAPYWTIYHNLILLAGGVPKIVQTNPKNGFHVDEISVEKAINSKTKMVIFNPGSNPVGTTYSREKTEKLLSIFVKNNLKVISDEVYSELVFDEKEFVSLASFPEFEKNIAVVQSVSKSFTMTGWRIGAILGPQKMINEVSHFAGITVSCTNTVSQYLTTFAFQNYEKIMPPIYQEVLKRRDSFFQNLNKIFNTNQIPSSSGLYAFLPISLFDTQEKSSIEFYKKMIEKANVAMIPGIVFGQEGFVRLSFGGKTEETKNGLLAMRKFLKK
jgi:aspartate/methionine/tyrosine aminotransferase